MKKIWKPSLKKNDLQIRSKDFFYSSYLKLFNYNIKMKLFKEKNFKFIKHDLVISKNSVAIILFDPYKKNILFVEQFRIGSMKNPWTLEIISGSIPFLTKNNTHIAIKEIMEESNTTCLDLFYILNYFNSPGISNEMTYIYLGIFNSNLVSNRDKVFGLSSDSEELITHLYDLDTALFFINKGIINHPSTIIAILWLKNKYYDIFN